MNTVTFKGYPPIPYGIANVDSQIIESSEDIMKTQDRKCLRIHFPVTTDFNKLLEIYQDSNALSEITLNNEIITERRITRPPTDEEFTALRSDKISEIKQRLQTEYSTKLINLSKTIVTYDSQITETYSQIASKNVVKEQCIEEVERLKNVTNGITKSESSSDGGTTDTYISADGTSMTQQDVDNVMLDISNAESRLDEVVNEIRALETTANVLLQNKTRALETETEFKTKLNGVETEAENLVDEEFSRSEVTIEAIESVVTPEIYVHTNYNIKLDLKLTTIGDGKQEWVMALAQMTDTDIALREIAGVVTKKTEFLTFDEYKEALIEKSKADLAKFLEEHPLISNCYHNEYHPFNATVEHRNLFVTHYLAHMVKQQAGITSNKMTWNISGQPCVEWTDEEALKYTIDMDNYVTPLVHAQQELELRIKAAVNKAEIDAIVIDYGSVETSNADPSLIVK